MPLPRVRVTARQKIPKMQLYNEQVTIKREKKKKKKREREKCAKHIAIKCSS